MRNVPWEWTITTITITYHIGYDIISNQIKTGMGLSGTCTRKLYIHIYTGTYDIHVQMIITKHVLVHIQDGNRKLIWLKYISHSLRHINNIRNENIYGCKWTTYIVSPRILSYVDICGTEHIPCECIWNEDQL